MKALARQGVARVPGGRATPSDRMPWTAETVPEELMAILDAAAGRQHSRTGSVASALADILNAYDAGSFRS